LNGGHNIESEVIERRYFSGIKNLFDIYCPISDIVLIYDNSKGNHDSVFQIVVFVPVAMGQAPLLVPPLLNISTNNGACSIAP
jgi:predicted ABC-type ATPase